MAKQSFSFQTEIQQLLDIMIHSLYSHKEIFLRELISNASDAIDKLKFLGLTDTRLIRDAKPFEIRLEVNKENNTLSIIDNGIGMSSEEIVKNIGTIAHSGTKQFLQSHKDLKANPELIGQFGVGFYSAFMVAKRVTIHSQKAGTPMGVVWDSSGDGNYTIDEVPRPLGHGTTLTLHLKAKEELEDQDFLDEWTLKNLVKKYSDFIAHPIVMKVTKSEPKKDEKGEIIKDQFESIVEDETLNSQKALWLRPQSEIKPEEYKEFYHHLCHDWTDPLKTIHYRAEGTMEFTALMYLPSKRPFNYQYKDYTHGLDLYVRRVFIMSECKELVPNYLRFMRGLVDSSDIALNVSRELVQKNAQVAAIKNSLTTKILNVLKDMLVKEREEYEKFWREFGETLKEGVAMDYPNQEKLLELALFHSNHQEKLTTLLEYKERMASDQKEIYYLTGESLQQIRNSPFMEKLNEKKYEVLLLPDVVDEWVANSVSEFKGIKLKNISRDDLELFSDDEKKKIEEQLKESEARLKPLLEQIKSTLEGQIKDVKISRRLTDSPACLVSAVHDPSNRMEKIMESLGQPVPKAKRILEVNPSHPVFDKMLSSNPEKQKEWTEIIYNQALLSEGSPLPDPMKFSKQISNLILGA